MNILANNLKKIKVITFDCTNTLFYFKKPPELQYLKTAESFGLKSEIFDKDLMKVHFRQQFKELQQNHPNFGRDSIAYESWWKKLVINVLSLSSREKIDEILLESVASKLISQYKSKECYGKFEKSNELIKAFKDAGKVVGIISNFDPRLHDLLTDMELPKFDFVVTSYEAGVEKPNAKIFHKAIEASKLNCDPSEALHIGNEMEKDFKGAINAGWKAILIKPEAKVQPSFNSVEHLWDSIKDV